MTALPVRDAVSNYEKISRIGEGTYGVVCEPFILGYPGRAHTLALSESA